MFTVNGGSTILFFTWRVNGHVCFAWSVNEDLFFPWLVNLYFRPRETGFRFFRDPWNVHYFRVICEPTTFAGIIFHFFGDSSVIKGRYTRGSLLPQHAPATRSRSKASSSAPTICSEKLVCATKLLLPSFAPSYQTGLIWGSKLQGQICCTILFHEQAPSCVLKFALRERVSWASSLVCTEICFAGACLRSKLPRVYWTWLFGSLFQEQAPYWLGYLPGSVFQEQAPSCVLVGVLTRERVSGAGSLVFTGLKARKLRQTRYKTCPFDALEKLIEN